MCACSRTRLLHQKRISLHQLLQRVSQSRTLATNSWYCDVAVLTLASIFTQNVWARKGDNLSRSVESHETILSDMLNRLTNNDWFGRLVSERASEQALATLFLVRSLEMNEQLTTQHRCQCYEERSVLCGEQAMILTRWEYVAIAESSVRLFIVLSYRWKKKWLGVYKTQARVTQQLCVCQFSLSIPFCSLSPCELRVYKRTGI